MEDSSFDTINNYCFMQVYATTVSLCNAPSDRNKENTSEELVCVWLLTFFCLSAKRFCHRQGEKLAGPSV